MYTFYSYITCLLFFVPHWKVSNLKISFNLIYKHLTWAASENSSKCLFILNSSNFVLVFETLKTNGAIDDHFHDHSEVLPTFIFRRVSLNSKHLLKFSQTDKLHKHSSQDAEFLLGDAAISFSKLNWLKIINILQDYSKFDLPNETQTVVNVGIDIKDIPKIADKEFSVTLNAFFVVRWKDERLVIDQVNFSNISFY